MPRRLRPRFLLAFGSVAPQAPRKTRILVVLITKLPGRRQVAPTRADHSGPPSLHDPSGSFASPELPRLRLSQRLVPRRALTLDLMRALVPRTSSLHDACTHKSPSLKIFQSLLHPDLGRPNEIFPPGGCGKISPGFRRKPRPRSRSRKELTDLRPVASAYVLVVRESRPGPDHDPRSDARPSLIDINRRAIRPFVSPSNKSDACAQSCRTDFAVPSRFRLTLPDFFAASCL